MTSLVSDNYIYEPTPRVLDGYSYRTLLSSESSSYQLGDYVRIAIPPVSNAFLNTANSWVNITIGDVVLNGTNIVQDTPTVAGVRHSIAGIHSLIDTCSVVSPNGQFLEHTPNYQSQQVMNWINNTDLSAALPNSITNNTPDVDNTFADFTTVNGNSIALTINAGATSATGVATEHFSPTLSCMLNGTKALPICWFASDTHLELLLTKDILSVFHNASFSPPSTVGGLTGGSCTITVEIDAMIDIVTDNSMTLIKKKAGYGSGPVSWSGTQQRSSIHSISTAELNTTGENIKSTIIGGVRPRKLLSIQQAAFVNHPSGHYDRWQCVNPYSNGSFQMRIGTQLFPPRPMESAAEMIQHVQKCYNQKSLTVTNNRLKEGFYGPRFSETGTGTIDTFRGSVGYDFCTFDGNTDGLDTTNIIIETLGGLKAVAGFPAQFPYMVVTVKRFQVLYSCDDAGNVSVSY